MRERVLARATVAALDGCGFLGGFVSAFTAGAGNTLDVTITGPS